MRMVTDRISHCLMGDGYRYFFFWCGDELLLDAKTDEEAIAAGAKLQEELEAEG